MLFDGFELLGPLERLLRLQIVALADERLALEQPRQRGVGIGLERDAHLGEHFVPAAERGQRHAEHEPALEQRRLPQKAEATDFHGLRILAADDRDLASLDEVERVGGQI